MGLKNFKEEFFDVPKENKVQKINVVELVDDNLSNMSLSDIMSKEDQIIGSFRKAKTRKKRISNIEHDSDKTWKQGYQLSFDFMFSDNN